jgi:nuclear migration protein JNM1
VRAEDVDFSDRLALGATSYRTYHTRRRLGAYDGEAEEFGEDSEEEEEGFDEKLARLRREVEALEEEAREQGEGREAGEAEREVERMSEVLGKLEVRRRGGLNADGDLERKLANPRRITTDGQKEANAGTAGEETKDVDAEVVRVLAQAADFDIRLSFLEQSLGLSSSHHSDTQQDDNPPILPTLSQLERSVNLATLQPGSLEAAQSKARQLLKDAAQLSRTKPPEIETTEPVLSPEQLSKINALYSLLPTIDSVSPTLPLILERLRSLQTVHTNAAGASEVLDEIEQRHEEQTKDIEVWRKALQAVEMSLKDGEGDLKENVEKMSGWIKELEGRIK